MRLQGPAAGQGRWGWGLRLGATTAVRLQLPPRCCRCCVAAAGSLRQRAEGTWQHTRPPLHAHQHACPPTPAPAPCSPETFGPVQSQLESALPPGQLWIHDTATQGRPDVVDLAVKAVRKENAEAM